VDLIARRSACLGFRRGDDPGIFEALTASVHYSPGENAEDTGDGAVCGALVVLIEKA
jgi:hypothetical protein